MTKDITWLHGYHEPDKDGLIVDSSEINVATIYDDDDWEDQDYEDSIHKKFPNWYLVKMTGFTTATFVQVEPWLKENCHFGQYQRVGWDTGCSYSVGVVFESAKDAMMFKLRWR